LFVPNKRINGTGALLASGYCPKVRWRHRRQWQTRQLRNRYRPQSPPHVFARKASLTARCIPTKSCASARFWRLRIAVVTLDPQLGLGSHCARVPLTHLWLAEKNRLVLNMTPRALRAALAIQITCRPCGRRRSPRLPQGRGSGHPGRASLPNCRAAPAGPGGGRSPRRLRCRRATMDRAGTAGQQSCRAGYSLLSRRYNQVVRRPHSTNAAIECSLPRKGATEPTAPQHPRPCAWAAILARSRGEQHRVCARGMVLAQKDTFSRVW
jgi:hypothetical protein